MFEVCLVGIHLCTPLPAPDGKNRKVIQILKHLDQIKLFTAEGKVLPTYSQTGRTREKQFFMSSSFIYI